MTEIEKLHGLHNTGMTMDQRFTLIELDAISKRGQRNPFAQQPFARRGNRNPLFARTRSQGIETLFNQFENQGQRSQPLRGMSARGRGRGRGGLRRFGSEGSIRSVGFGRGRSNSFGDMDQANKDQRWRRSNGNLSMNGSVHSGRAGSEPRGYWLRGEVSPRRTGARGRGRRGRGRVQQGRVNRLNTTVGGRARPARGVGRRGMRRNNPVSTSVRNRGRGRGTGYQRGRGRGRGGISRNQTLKPALTKEELDAELEQYMAGTKAALDKELDEYMRNAMEFD